MKINGLNIKDPQKHAIRQVTGGNRIIKEKKQIYIPPRKRQQNINQLSLI